MRAAVISILGLIVLRGQTPPAADPISADRPAFANSSTVVPQGSFQVENGFLWSNSHNFDGPETAMRFGLTGYKRRSENRPVNAA
jgi:hypothetical protein